MTSCCNNFCYESFDGAQDGLHEFPQISQNDLLFFVSFRDNLWPKMLARSGGEPPTKQIANYWPLINRFRTLSGGRFIKTTKRSTTS
jgi:hypothetical protein